jgi:16S rRNA processing protein RimM
VTERDLVVIGRIIKAHGLRGEVAVHVLSDVPGRFDAGSQVHLEGRATRIEASRPHQGRLLLQFAGVTDRTAAELLRGKVIEAEPADVSDSETYYAHELVDMAVVDERGGDLGRVSALIELPDAAGYDLLEVTRADGGTWLLPAVDDFEEVQEADDGSERLRLVNPPDGLVDPAEAEVVRPDPSVDPASDAPHAARDRPGESA